MRRAIIIGTGLTLLLAAHAAAQDAKTAKGSDGKEMLQTPAGMTLYVFDGDRQPNGGPAGSTCYDECAKLWPAFTAPSDAKASGDWTVTKRKDGTSQWEYKGRPLYTFMRDKAPGQEQGNAFNGNKWHVVQP